MKKLLTFVVLFIGILGLGACEDDPNETKRLTVNGKTSYYRIRTDQKVFEDALDETVTIIKDHNSLNEYFDTVDSFYDINQLTKQTKPYDEEFFETNTLILISLHENSGSITHTLEQLEIVDETLETLVRRHIGELGTTDMAAWHMVIEYGDLLEDDLNTELTISK